MAELIIQGQLSTSGTIIEPGAESKGLRIQSIRINNSTDAYTYKLERYQFSTGLLTTIYDLTLSLGDTVTDAYSYYLAPGDYLILTSDVGTTNYLINGIQ
jgi:hypothetical protein